MKHFAAILLAVAYHGQALGNCETVVEEKFAAYKSVAVSMYPKIESLKNVTVQTGNISGKFFAMTYFNKSRPWIIVDNRTCQEPLAHLEATIAHELGHVIAHDTYAKHGEATANKYASSILGYDIKLALVEYLDGLCDSGNKPYCQRGNEWKTAFNMM